MKHSDSMVKIAPALLAAQAELDTVPLDDNKNNFNKRYTSLGTILEKAKEVLNKHDMVIIQPGDASDLAGHLNIETVILHKSGEFVSGVFSVPYGDMTPQKAGSAITYARRYSAASILGLVSEADDDGASASAPPATKPAASKPAPKSQPKPDPKPAPKKEERTSAELKEGAIKAIKACMDSRKVNPNNAAELDVRVEKAVNYSRGKVTDIDFKNIQDLAKVYFDA